MAQSEVIIEGVCPLGSLSSSSGSSSKGGGGKNLLRSRESVDWNRGIHLELAARLQNSKDHNRVLPQSAAFRISFRSTCKATTEATVMVQCIDPLRLMNTVTGTRREPFPYWRFLISIALDEHIMSLRDPIDGFSFALEAQMLESHRLEYVTLRNVYLRDISAAEYIARRPPSLPIPPWLQGYAGGLPQSLLPPMALPQPPTAASSATSQPQIKQEIAIPPPLSGLSVEEQQAQQAVPPLMPAMWMAMDMTHTSPQVTMHLEFLQQQQQQQEQQQQQQQMFAQQSPQLQQHRQTFGIDEATLAAISAYDAANLIAQVQAKQQQSQQQPPQHQQPNPMGQRLAPHFPPADLMAAVGGRMSENAPTDADLMELDFYNSAPEAFDQFFKAY